MYPILFHFGPFTLHTYGLMVALGFLSGYTLARGRYDERRIPLSFLDQLVVYVMLAGLLGARLMYFVLSDPSSLKTDPFSFFRIWEGGLVFYGGLIGGILAVAIYARIKEIRFLIFLDAFVPSLLLAQAFGRLGCFSAGCCYGKPYSGPGAVLFTDPESLGPRFIAVHPVQLYEAGALVLLLIGALWLNRRKPQIGMLTVYYLLSYSLVRFVMEFLRGDDRGEFISGLSPAQTISLLLVAAGFGVWAHVRKTRSL